MEDSTSLIGWGIFAFAISVLYRGQRSIAPVAVTPATTHESEKETVTTVGKEVEKVSLTRSVTIPALTAADTSSHLAVSNSIPAAPPLNEDDSSFEILLHNVSHSDVVFQVANPANPSYVIFARPKFSCFKAITESIYHGITYSSSPHLNTIYQPVYGRQTDFRHCIKSSTEGYELPVGVDLSDRRIAVNKHKLKYRTNEKELVESNSCQLVVMYFPLLAILLEKWLHKIDPTNDSSIRKVVFLVSGEGVPRDSTARVEDNSTAITAKLMKLFIEKEYSNISVQLVHSTTNIFRYDENIKFVKHELLPKIEGYRNYLAYERGSAWREQLRLTMSFADGSSARISAINAALRPYRPSYMHFWQLKTFWYESKLCSDDIEHHSYEEISTIPAVHVSHTTGNVRRVIDEMLRFKSENDLSSFWLRKTRKPVLAVLLVQRDPDEPPKLFRGTNMEVSMPTGSLCAERNVIGTALADDLTLKRHHIKLVAVLSVTLNPTHRAASVLEMPSPVNTSFSARRRTISNAEEYPNALELVEEHQSHILAAQLANQDSNHAPPSAISSPATPSNHHRRTSSDMSATIGSPSQHPGTPKAAVKYRNIMALDLNSSTGTSVNGLVAPPLCDIRANNGISVLDKDECSDEDEALDMSDTWRPADGEESKPADTNNIARRRFSTGYLYAAALSHRIIR